MSNERSGEEVDRVFRADETVRFERKCADAHWRLVLDTDLDIVVRT